MEQKELIQLSIQLPLDALGRLSALLERIERLFAPTEEGRESGTSTSFDPQLFHTLEAAPGSGTEPPRAAEEPAQAARAAFTGTEDAIPAGNAMEEASASPMAEASGRELPPPELPWRAVWDAPPAGRAAPDVQPIARPATAQAEAASRLSKAPIAGLPVENELPQPRGGRFAMAEELTGAGSAPLTAQAVSMAFQRDDRRYDNGFPLY